jgi:hypothetical protein
VSRCDRDEVLLLQDLDRAGSLRFVRQIPPDPTDNSPRRFVVDVGRGQVELLACEVASWLADLDAPRTVVPVPLDELVTTRGASW